MNMTPEDIDALDEGMMNGMNGLMPMSDDESDDEGRAPSIDLNSFFGNSPMQSEENQGNADGKQNAKPKGRRGTSYLRDFCLNLTERAREGKLDNIVGRDNELERVVQILSRRQKNNPCLIGEPGVGKTAIAEELAKRIVEARKVL